MALTDIELMQFYCTQREDQIHGITQLMVNISKINSQWALLDTLQRNGFVYIPFQDPNMTVITDVAYFCFLIR